MTDQQIQHINRGEVAESMEQDLDFHAAVCMPDDATCSYPDLFIKLWLMLTAALGKHRDFSKFAVGLPRGHGKTMFIKLLVVWTILFTDRKFILIVGASDELAGNILADIADVMDSNNIRALFGNWRANMERDTKNFKKFTINGRPVILKSVGAQTAMRGITVKNKRPDFMIFDDAQTETCAASITEAIKFRRWFRGTALKAKNPFTCTFVYIGNMYADLEIQKGQYTCMLRNLQKSPEWTSFIVGGILADGTALWEEVQPLEQLMAEFRDDLAAGTPEIFFAEVMNDPGGTGNSNVDISKIITYDRQVGEVPQGKFIIIDPANDKDLSDDTAIGYFEIIDGRAVLTKLYAEKLSGPNLVHKVIELCAETGCSLVFVEAVAYQFSLCGWFDFILAQVGMDGIHVEPVYPRGRSKNSRILDMFKALVSGDIMLSTQVLTLVILQIRKFNRLVKDNEDDILDILAYSEQVMGNHLDLLAIEGLADTFDDQDFNSVPKVSDYSGYVQ